MTALTVANPGVDFDHHWALTMANVPGWSELLTAELRKLHLARIGATPTHQLSPNVMQALTCLHREFGFKEDRKVRALEPA
ncbi:hypothetical protein J2D73_12545 [Acetobacter sacchari]|uniref:Transposase n=1 Tax=Acetobacter sacchari TaxID=2661687 RepID=A0ABS3LXG8_9PROT|nr:hypothetical protein [Acetobacter sacchari]MBO1360617.1 hypothetical protein [Acetobacter sacchari]